MASARLRHDARIVSREKGRARSQLAATRRVGQAERGGHDARNAEERRRSVTVCLTPSRAQFALVLLVEERANFKRRTNRFYTGFIP